MIPAIKTFLIETLQMLVLQDGETPPYLPADPEVEGDLGTIFFGELPRDFLKDHDFAFQALALQDRKIKEGRLIGRVRNAEATRYRFTRRRYRREILFRCFIYAPRYEDLFGEEGFIGLVDQFEQTVANTRVLADSGNNVIHVELQDAVRPWGSESEADRQKGRPNLAIIRLKFNGGVHTTEEIPIIQTVEITPAVGTQE